MQTVYLNGDIAKFGQKWETDCTNIRDIFKLIECQTPEFRKYLIEASEADVSYEIQRGKEVLESADELLLSLNNEDIIITEVPSGSKTGAGKVIAAIAITILLLYPPTSGPVATFLTGTKFGIEGATVLASIAANLAITGINQLLAPGPEVDAANENKGYLFSGATNTATQGMPVPLAYGELVIGGTPISVNFDNRPIAIGSYTNTDDDEGKVLIDYTGGEYIPPKADETTVTTTDDDDTTTDKTTAGGGGTTSDDGDNPDEREDQQIPEDKHDKFDDIKGSFKTR